MPELPVLVIGGGPAGLEAARGVADLGYPVTVVEKADRLGGTPILEDYAALTPNMVNAEEAMGEMVQRIANDDLIEIRTSTEVVSASGTAPVLDVALKAVRNPEFLAGPVDRLAPEARDEALVRELLGAEVLLVADCAEGVDDDPGDD